MKQEKSLYEKNMELRGKDGYKKYTIPISFEVLAEIPIYAKSPEEAIEIAEEIEIKEELPITNLPSDLLYSDGSLEIDYDTFYAQYNL